MELTNDFKKTEVGVIPIDWTVATIGDICDIKVGRDLHEDRYSQICDHNFKYPIFSNTVSNYGLYGYYNFPEYEGEAITVVGRGVGLGCAFPRSGGFGAIGRLLVLFPNKTVRSHFLSSYINNRITIFNESGGIPQLTGISFSRYKVPVPPVKEQETIANALSDADAYIESLEKLIAKKRLIKKGIMQELLTGRRRLEGFNDKWTTKPFGDLFQFSGGYSASRDDLSGEGHPYLHYGDIHTSNKTYIDLSKETYIIPKLNIPLAEASVLSLLQHGDVVFVDASEDDEGTSKHVVVYNPEKMPFISGLHTIVAKARSNELEVNYRRFCFQSDEIRKQFKFYAVGTKVSGVSKTNIAKINLTFPSMDEQKAIASFLIDIESEQEALIKRLEKARLLKQGMMQELLTGRIRLV